MDNGFFFNLTYVKKIYPFHKATVGKLEILKPILSPITGSYKEIITWNFTLTGLYRNLICKVVVNIL